MSGVRRHQHEEVEHRNKPNDFKRAGHYAFWIRKLKPFRVFRVREIIEQIEALRPDADSGCAHDYECVRHLLPGDSQTPERPRHRYVNEMIAVWIAIAFMTGKVKPREILLTKTFLHDFLARLRYDAYTPDNLALLFEAMAQQKR